MSYLLLQVVADLGSVQALDLGSNKLTGSAIELDCSGDITFDEMVAMSYLKTRTEFGRRRYQTKTL